MKMLSKAFVLCCFLIFGAYSDDFSLLNFPSDSLDGYYVPRVFRTSEPSQKVEEKEREPLSPDYKDPVGSSSNQKPVLNPKPHNPKPILPEVNPLLPGGIVDVDASGLGAPNFNLGGFDRGDFGLHHFDLPNFNARPGILSFGGFFGPDVKPWWKGDNVCVERSETTDDEDDEDEDEKKNNTSSAVNLFATTIRLSNCQESENKYECVTKINNHGVIKTFTVTYKCCYGFKRESGNVGCTKQVELKTLMETFDVLGATEFKNMVSSTGLESKCNSDNLTVFAPINEALNEYHEDMSDLNNVEAARRRRAIKNAYSSKDLVLNHLTPGFVDLTELSNEELIYSENNNSSLRINIYPTHTYEKMLTVNCARVKKTNNLAKNGIVHLINGVIETASQSIEDIIREHPKLTSLRKVFENTNIKKHMKLDGHYTVFAPTDEAFNKLEESQKQKILSGDACAPSIIKHHITTHTVCSSAIIGNATTHNVEGDVLNMERTEEDDLIFEGKAKIVETDIIATNGVIHLIDTVIIPDSALYIGNVIKSQNFSKFEELVEKAGLTEEIDNLENSIVFVPSNDAFERPETIKLLEEANNDPEKLKEIVRYHTVQGQMQSCDMTNNEKLLSKNDKELRVNLYTTLPFFTNIVNRATINCARLIGFDEKACGSVVHEVNRVLVPPTQNILEFIRNNEKFSTLSKIIEGTEAEEVFQQQNRSITFLATSDETLQTLEEKELKSLLEDKEKANAFLKAHTLTEVLCCSGVGPHSWGFDNLVQSMSRRHYEIGRSGSQVRINGAVVTSCDNLTVNGVVHTINKVLLPRPQIPTVAGGFFLFDL